jgi:hypothetical protein
MKSRSLALVALLVAACGGSDDPPPVDARVPDGRVPDAGDEGTIDADTDLDADDSPLDADLRPDGAQLVDTDIRVIQVGVTSALVDERVRVADVVVTARKDFTTDGQVTSTVLFVQEPTGLAPNSGVMVFMPYTTPGTAPFTMPNRGDRVTLVGTVAEFEADGQSRTNLEFITDLVILGTDGVIPDPAVVDETTLVEVNTAEQWEGVLISVVDVSVASIETNFGEFRLTGGPEVDDRLFQYSMPAVADTFQAIVGPLEQSFGTYRILPRDAADMIGKNVGPLAITSLTPEARTIATGADLTMTVTLNGPAPTGGAVIDLTQSPSGFTTLSDTSITIASGSTTGTFTVHGDAIGGPVTVTATLNGTASSDTALVTVAATVTTTLQSIAPTAITVSEDGTGILLLRFDPSAPPLTDVDVSIATSSGNVARPATVTLPAGETEVAFRVRGVTPTGGTPATITASFGGVDVTATVAVVTAPRRPDVDELLITEFLFDPEGMATTDLAGDANCSGERDAMGDEFIEIRNVSADVLDLTGIVVDDGDPAPVGGTEETFAFGTLFLGPGEVVVVFGNEGGDSNSGPWCDGVTTSTIGDAVMVHSLTKLGTGLSNSGDDFTVTDGATVITSMSYGGAAPDESMVWTGTAYAVHSSIAGHATDRKFTPGTETSGADFAAATAP